MFLGCLWVLAATVTAMLPYRYQFPPGVLLLLLTPVLLVWIGVTHGPWIAAAGVFAFVSMFRRPLAHLARKLLNRRVKVEP